VRAIGVIPGQPDTAGVYDVPEPPPGDGSVLVQGLSVGLCGTDLEIVRDGYGEVPAGAPCLVLGHESLGRVLEAPPESGLSPGQLVVGVVRRPDPEPCPYCAAGEWDLCANGGYVERGIKGAPGYGSERWRVDPAYAVAVDPELGHRAVLLETTSVVVKAWEFVQRIGTRSTVAPSVALVTGAGPVGLLAAQLARQRGLETWVLDVVADGPKPALVAAIGAHYWSGPAAELPARPQVVVECTGFGPVLQGVMAVTAANAVVALAGVSHHTDHVEGDLQALNRRLVLENRVIFGTVNAARRHYDRAAECLRAADPAWLDQLLTRTVRLEEWTGGLTKEPDDIKVTVDLT
jgi:threonine dehydrogenase-like Zn-dependent dehydrogenase